MSRAQPTTSELLMFVSGYLQRVLRSEAREHRIRWNALMVLNDLNILGPCTQRTLADIEQIRAPTLTLLAQQMEARGWVRRTQSKDDARVSVVSITEKGRKELGKANERLRRRVDEELQVISAETRDHLGGGLLPLVGALMRGLHDRPVTQTGSRRAKTGEAR